MRYKEIDFFSHHHEQLPENAVLMIWLSYLDQGGAIKMWHGILQAETNENRQLEDIPLKIFEKQACIAIRDYKEVYEVICCKVSHS